MKENQKKSVNEWQIIEYLVLWLNGLDKVSNTDFSPLGIAVLIIISFCEYIEKIWEGIKVEEIYPENSTCKVCNSDSEYASTAIGLIGEWI